MTAPAGPHDQRPYVSPGTGGTKTFDRLFAEAAPLVHDGLHQRETPPVEGGRWPVSVVLRPDHASAERLEQAMAEVEAYAGSGHFRTGIAGSVHFTVRVLECYRESVGEQDKAVQRYSEALRRAASQVGSVGLKLAGLTLAPGSVMVRAFPLDDNADSFMDLLKGELKDDGWREAGFRRDIWYANILHFASAIDRPAELINWLAQRRELDLGHTVIDTAELVRFRYEDGPAGRLMRPEVLANARTGSYCSSSSGPSRSGQPTAGSQ
jgi:hypothetical protein